LGAGLLLFGSFLVLSQLFLLELEQLGDFAESLLLERVAFLNMVFDSGAVGLEFVLFHEVALLFEHRLRVFRPFHN